MDTFKLHLIGGGVKYFPWSTVSAEDMEDSEVIQKAREALVLKDEDQVEAVEHWPSFDKENTKPSTFHLMGRLEVAKGITLEKDPAGNPVYKHPNGNTYRIVVSMQETGQTGESRELGTADMDDAGFICFGELDQQDVRIDEEEG